MLQYPNTNVHQEVKPHIKTAFKNNPHQIRGRTQRKGGGGMRAKPQPPAPPPPKSDKYVVSITTGEYLQRTWLKSSIGRSWVPGFSQQHSFIEMKITGYANPCVWSSHPPGRYRPLTGNVRLKNKTQTGRYSLTSHPRAGFLRGQHVPTAILTISL